MAGFSTLGLNDREQRFDPNYVLPAGEVIARTFSVWLSNFVPFTILGAVLLSPTFACSIARVLLTHESPAYAALGTIGNLLERFLSLVLTGAVTYGVFQDMSGQRATVGDNLRVGLSRLGAIFVVSLLSGLAILLGVCLLIVPGIIFALMYWVAIPVAVVEETGGSGALTRSSDLTRGNRWSIFGISLVTSGLFVIVVLTLAFVMGAVLGEGLTRHEALFELGINVITLPLVSLQAIAPSVTYHYLRIGKEGADVDELVRVFE
jgi:hypothetical protein